MPRRQIRYRVVYSQEPMSDADLRRAESLFARLVARAYMAEHRPDALCDGSASASCSTAPEFTKGDTGDGCTA